MKNKRKQLNFMLMKKACDIPIQKIMHSKLFSLSMQKLYHNKLISKLLKAIMHLTSFENMSDRNYDLLFNHLIIYLLINC